MRPARTDEGGWGLPRAKRQEKRLRPSLRGTASSSLVISASCSLQRRSVTPRRLKRTQGHAGTRGPARSHPAIDARRRIAEALWSHDSSYMRRSGDAARFRLLLPRRTRGGRCVSASTHASTSRMDWMGCCSAVAFHGGFLARILGDLGALENRYWGQRGSGNSTTRSQSDDATSKRKGGAAFPRLLSGCHWIPFWTRFW